MRLRAAVPACPETVFRTAACGAALNNKERRCV